MKERAVKSQAIATMCHGRFLVDAPDGIEGSDEKPPLLVGCHGYGENARNHLRALNKIPGAETWLKCAIEALHPFYNTKTGDVIGCWMTKRDRELAIDDNVRYVANVISTMRRDYPTSGVLVIAGFSQGAAMAYRAALRAGFPCRGLMILAGDVPPELAGNGHHAFPPILLGRGTTDPLYSAEQMDKDLQVLASRGADVTSCVFEGGHVWDDVYLKAAGDFLRRLAS